MPFLAANQLFDKPKENIPEGSQQTRSDYRSLGSMSITPMTQQRTDKARGPVLHHEVWGVI